jgi:hypothetical protein
LPSTRAIEKEVRLNELMSGELVSFTSSPNHVVVSYSWSFHVYMIEQVLLNYSRTQTASNEFILTAAYFKNILIPDH